MSPNHIIISLLLLCGIIPSSAVNSYVEIPEEIGLNGTQYSVSAFSPKTFVRSAEFQLNSTQCIQYSFKMMERRVRLHAFTCQVSSGGFCTLDKFSFPNDRSGCTYLRPWSHKVDSWSFYFMMEKRPRKYGKAYHLRGKKMRREADTTKSMSIEPFGILELYGLVPCTEVCKGSNDDDKLGSQSDGTFHRPRSSRIFY